MTEATNVQSSCPMGWKCNAQHWETPWDRLGELRKRGQVTNCSLFGLGPPVHHILSIWFAKGAKAIINRILNLNLILNLNRIIIFIRKT